MEGSEPAGIDIKLREIMRPAVTVEASATAREAMEIMRQQEIRGLPVADSEGRLEGTVTDESLLLSATPSYLRYVDNLPSISEQADRWVHYVAGAGDKPVREVMSNQSHQVDIGRSEVVAVYRMLHGGTPTVIVTEGGRVAGIVDRLDLYAAIVGEAPAEDR